MSRVFLYLLKLFLAFFLIFLIHVGALYFLEKPLFQNMIIVSYIVNFAMATIVLLIVERTLQKKSAQSGFVFMAGSGLKFLAFFLIFYPSYREDGTMSTIEFVTFFIPYAFCLIADVVYLSKQLNNQTYL